MKTIIFSICFNLIIVGTIISQSDPIQLAEILIKNSTSHIVTVKVFPVSAVFSGYGLPFTNDSSYFRKYSLMRSDQSGDPFWPIVNGKKYITGGKKTIQSNSYAVVDFDDGAYFDIVQQADKVIGGVSYGLWKFEFYYTPDAQTEEENIDLIADCCIDYRDINHGYFAFTNDIYFNLIKKANSNADSLVFNWTNGDTVNIFNNRINNKIIKSWHKVGVHSSTYGDDPIIPGSPNAGLFKTLPYFFSNYPIDATVYGAVSHLNPDEIGMNIEIDSNGTKIKENNTLNFKNANISIKSGINFSMEDSSNLVLDNSKFSTNESSGLKTFIMGNNAVINVINGSSINLKYTNFYSTSGKIWSGLKFEDSGVDTITNCTFSNAKTSLSFINTQASCFTSRVIKNNTFNVPSGSQNHYGIYAENNFRILIQDNVFNMPSNPANYIFGVYLKNNILNGNTQLITEEEATPTYQMYLINNTFNNGTVSAVLDNYTSAYLPYYVKNNIFNSASMIGILGKYISGSIKDNKISYSGTPIPKGIQLITSSPDLYQNYIGSENVSLNTIASSYPNLAPIVSGSNMSWTGGKNRLTSFTSDNIHLVNSGNVFTNLGENRFTILDTINGYHIYGKVDTSVHVFNATNNCWYPGGNARIDLRRLYTNVPIICRTSVTSIDCSREIDPNGWIVEYMGNGIYDSVKQTADTAGSNLTPEEHLYYQGKNYLTANLYLDGISSFKDLIDTYNYFDYLPASVYDLYSSYVGLDSADTNQTHINIRYGNLKDYLDDKIYNNGDFDAEFLSNAYNVTIMCDANMQNYNNAANAYEFIALYHPDPDIRLNASWDYAEIEALMGGGFGGGERQLQVSSDKLQVEEQTKIQEVNEIKRINEIISNDPIMSIMKKTYEKIAKEKDEKNVRIEKQVNEELKANENSTERSSEKRSENLVKSEQIEKQKESDRFKNEKAKRNIFELKNLNKQELEKRRIEDLLLTAKDERNTTSETDQNISNPLDFSLSQNYPNPFNPVTNLEFQIPKSGLVSLKVYDLLGKEIATIVNENLNPGTYRYIFDGSNFASGVYFYKLVSGDFVAVKRMVLVK